jgi:hypothetical protein
MLNSAVVCFPFKEDFENNCLARATNVNDTLISVMKSWILTRKGSRLGNMVGCFLPDIIYELVSINDMSGLSTRLKTDITKQFPNVTFLDVNLQLSLVNKFVDVLVNITFTTSITDITQFQLILPTTIESHN